MGAGVRDEVRRLRAGKARLVGRWQEADIRNCVAGICVKYR